ncbi:MAG TPA: hypothetical protein VJ144_04360, partial [Candidatus Polarisedimenticolia bacterium]|nr:hypothetical protein [Candidatus Polarisedimenticolia bacterium]
MEFLSLQEPIPEPAAQVTRTDAVVISVGLHVLALVLFLFLPRYLPPSVLELFAPKPVRVASLRPEARPLTQPVPRRAETPLRRPRIPLKFAYVKVPNDVAAPKNPLSPLLSDKDRRARQEMPTPPGTRKPSLDPHSQGDTIERVRPDPNLAGGRDSLEAPVPQGSHQAESDRVAAMRATRKESRTAAAAGPGASSAAGADGEGTVGQSPQAPREDGLLTRIPNAPQTAHGGPPGAGPGGGAAVLSDEARESLRRAL